MNKPLGALLNDGDVEAKWGKKHGYMSDLRKRGMGPAYLRLGPRTIRYRPEAVDAYEDQQENAPATSDFKAPASSAENFELTAPRKKIVRLPTGLNNKT